MHNFGRESNYLTSSKLLHSKESLQQLSVDCSNGNYYLFYCCFFVIFYSVLRSLQGSNKGWIFSKKVTETSSGGKCETLQQQHHGQRLAEAVTVDPCSILDANGVLQEKRKGEICGGQALSLNKIHLHRLPWSQPPTAAVGLATQKK